METLYIFQLPAPVDGQTHVGVTEHKADGSQTRVTGVYGKMSRTDPPEWQPAVAMSPWQRSIRGYYRADLVIQANAAGRPVGLADHDMRDTDMQAWLEEDPAVVQARIDARTPPPAPGDPVVIPPL